ncbi:MAG: NUDIX hydrolase [Bacteroidota bacterium]
MFTFSKPRWIVTEDKKVYETPIFSLNQKKVIPDGGSQPANFYVLNAPEWINVIALTGNNEVVLVEQYRHGIDETTLEIPGGMVDAGEDPLEAARRELSEETGYATDQWEKLGETSSNPAILSNYTHLYLAKNCKRTSEQATDGHEDIDVHVMPLKRFMELVDDGTVHHAIVVAAVARLLLRYPGLR